MEDRVVLVQIGGITIDLQAIKQDFWNIQELTPDKCIINFKGKTDEFNNVINRAPLILECPIAFIMDLLEKSEPVKAESVMDVAKKMQEKKGGAN